MYVALGPTRRSEETRAPSIRIRVRPRARPRTAGTAAWPSETLETPATLSRVCVRLNGWRASMSGFGTIVVPLAGDEVMVGAAPAVTVTLSSASGWTSIVAGPVSGTVSTRIGFM